MPARHGGPRVHSNNASRGAGRACTRLQHCGSHRARGLFCFRAPLSETLTSFSCWEEGWGSGRSDRTPAFLRSLVFGRKQGPWPLNYYDGRAQVLLGKFGVWVFFFFSSMSLLQRALLPSSGAQPPRLHFSQFPCNHLILVSPPPPPPPPS